MKKKTQQLNIADYQSPFSYNSFTMIKNLVNRESWVEWCRNSAYNSTPSDYNEHRGKQVLAELKEKNTPVRPQRDLAIVLAVLVGITIIYVVLKSI